MAESDSANITEKVLMTENKYLTKVAAWAVAALIATVLYTNNQQVKAIEGNKNAIDKLTGIIGESNIASNNRFNQINNRIDLRDEKSSAVVKELRDEDKRLWKAIEGLKN